MTFFYDLNKKLAGIAGAKQLNEGVESAQEDIYMEKIEPPIKTDPAERGKYKGHGVSDLKKQMASVKDRMASYKERGEKVPDELRGKFSELTFAIRAKQAHGGKWGKIKEEGDEQLDEISLDQIGRGIGKAIGVPARVAGAVAGIPQGMKQAYQASKQGAVKAISGQDMDCYPKTAKVEEAASKTARMARIAKACARDAFSNIDRKMFLKAAELFAAGDEQRGLDAIRRMDTEASDDFYMGCDEAGIPVPVDESALQAYLGKKKYGEAGMKALQQAGREGASKEKMARIRAQHDKMDEAEMGEGNRFAHNVLKAKAAGLKKADLDGDGDMEAVREGAKPDFLDLDKDGNKLEPMRKAARDLAKKKQADEGIEDVPTYIRDKMGKPRLTPADLKRPSAYRFRVGEKEFMDQRAAQEFAAGTGQKVEPISEKKEKTLWPGTPEYEKQFPKDMKTGEKKRSSTGGEIEKTATGIKHTAKAYDDEEEGRTDDGAPKKRGRPKGSRHSLGAKFTGKSKLLKKSAIREEGMEDEEMIAVVDRGEYDREGDMAHDQLRTIEDAARELASIIDADDNLPEWVQSKITKAMDYIDTARDHLKSKEGGDQPVAEKAVSKAQQRFMGMAHAMQKGEKIPGASKELKQVAKSMKKGDVKDFAKTKHAGLPEKIKKDESVEETADEAPKAAKKMGGIQFGKGVYEAMDEALEKVITESINVSVNMSTDEQGEPRKSISVNAEGEDADRLAELLNLAGIQGHQQVDEVDENQADWPTAEVEPGEDPHLYMYAGGLNKPKSSGQTVDAPPNLELRRNGVGVKENADLGMNLYRELQQFKGR